MDQLLGSTPDALRKDYPEVPVIRLDNGSEFEELVPKSVYFDSLREIMAEFSENAQEELQQEKYTKWEEAASLPEQMAFSKRVNRFVQDKLHLSVEKPRVMKHALQNVPLEQVTKEPLLKLLAEIRNQLGD